MMSGGQALYQQQGHNGHRILKCTIVVVVVIDDVGELREFGFSVLGYLHAVHQHSHTKDSILSRYLLCTIKVNF